jgi:hypothetical protein
MHAVAVRGKAAVRIEIRLATGDDVEDAGDESDGPAGLRWQPEM